jgi:protein FRA10AC1
LKIGLRWRTQDEVFKGKGQFICGNKKCDRKDDLKSYEVNFAYVEAKEKKNALVKLRTCPECAFKLNYKSIKKQQKEMKKQDKKRRKLEQKAHEQEGEGEEDNLEDDIEAQKALQEAHKKAAEEEANRQKLADAWKQKPELEKTKEEEFEEYFDGMFL